MVDAIPEGCVMTYGDVAEMVGAKGPRRVGRVMSEYGAATTWWRVVRAGGHPPAGLEDEALAHWRAEGTPWSAARSAAGGSTCARARWDGTAGGGAVGGV